MEILRNEESLISMKINGKLKPIEMLSMIVYLIEKETNFNGDGMIEEHIGYTDDDVLKMNKIVQKYFR